MSLLCPIQRGTLYPIAVLPWGLVPTFSFLASSIGSHAKMASILDCSGICTREEVNGSKKHGWGCDHRGLPGGFFFFASRGRVI